LRLGTGISADHVIKGPAGKGISFLDRAPQLFDEVLFLQWVILQEVRKDTGWSSDLPRGRRKSPTIQAVGKESGGFSIGDIASYMVPTLNGAAAT